MPSASTREIVVELERVQVVERRAPVCSAHCRHCWRERDFVSVEDAARIFDVKPAIIEIFAKSGRAHVQQVAGKASICVASVLAHMRSCRDKPSFRLTG